MASNHRGIPRAQIGWLALLGLWLLTSAALAQGTPEARYAASLVDQDEYHNVHWNLLYTHTGHNRGFGAQHDLARNNIQSRFQNYGLTTTLDPFTYSSNTYYNVVGELTGTTRPDEVYIIGAHYDSVNNPGADDNASGTAAVIEAARLISQWESEATIRFIAFDREEQGLYGSDAYATEYQNDDIRSMISLDMIAYRDGMHNQARIYGRTASGPLKTALRTALNNYGGIAATIYGSLDASDHAPFEWEGFQACLLIEEDVWDNPWYHTAQDAVETPGNVDYSYATMMTKGVVGWLVDAAGVTPPPPAGDMNGDYLINSGDIPLFVLAFTDPAAYEALYPDLDVHTQGDVNGDGLFNAADIPAFVDLLTG